MSRLIGITVTGIAEAEQALLAMEQRIRSATRKAVSESMKMAQRGAHAQLSRYSHAPGTPTPSPPGEPPARITGNLRGSLSPTGPIPTGAGFMGRLGPTAPYARIQELGGVTGRGSVLPARPYMRPTYERMLASGELHALFTRAWLRAL